MQKRVETSAEVQSATAKPDTRSDREKQLDRKIRIYTVLFLILVGIFAVFKAYALLAPKYLS